MKKVNIQPHALSEESTNKIRCGAKTRSGVPCKSFPANGRNRCRMHGGAKGSGAPLGNKNAWKHGFYSREMKLQKLLAKTLISDAEKLMRDIS